RNAFYRKHLRHEMRKQHREVSRTGADLEHSLLARELEQLEIPRVDPWLRDRLAVADWQRRVLVRAVPKAGRHERVARRHLERTENGEIPDALLLQRLDEPLPRAAILGFYRSRHQVSAPCKASK